MFIKEIFDSAYEDHLTSDEVIERVSAKSINNTLKIADECNIEFKKEEAKNLIKPSFFSFDSLSFL